MTIITIAAAGIATVLLAVQLKGLKGEYAAYMVMAAGAFIFFYGTGKLKDILEALERIQGYIKVNSVYLVTLLKMVGITYVAEFASGICKDAGYGSLGNQIEIFGKLSILGISMPILLALFGTLETFLGRRDGRNGESGARPCGAWQCCLPEYWDGQADLFTALRQGDRGQALAGNRPRDGDGTPAGRRGQRQGRTRLCRTWDFRMKWRGFSSFWMM